MLQPVEATNPLVEAWPNIRSQLHSILEQDTTLNLDWKAIDVLRIGFQTTPLPFPIIVSITVDWKVDSSDWIVSEERIQELLNKSGFPDVKVEFEHGEVNATATFPIQLPQKEIGSCVSGDIIYAAYKDRISIGADFGPARYFKRAPSGVPINGPFATLGGYIIARERGKPPMKLALTNYHAVREAIEGFEYVDKVPMDVKAGFEDALALAGSELHSKLYYNLSY